MTKASVHAEVPHELPPVMPRIDWMGLAVGKLLELVKPVTKAFPVESTAIPLLWSTPAPPSSVA